MHLAILTTKIELIVSLIFILPVLLHTWNNTFFTTKCKLHFVPFTTLTIKFDLSSTLSIGSSKWVLTITFTRNSMVECYAMPSMSFNL